MVRYGEAHAGRSRARTFRHVGSSWFSAASLIRVSVGVRQGDAAKDFVEPAFFGVQFFDRPAFARPPARRSRGPDRRGRLVFGVSAERRAASLQHDRTFATSGSCASFCRTMAALPSAQPHASPRPHVPSVACNSSGVPLATIWPRSMMIAREQTASTSSRMCVEKMIAFVSPIAGSASAPRVSGWDRGRRSVRRESAPPDRE